MSILVTYNSQIICVILNGELSPCAVADYGFLFAASTIFEDYCGIEPIRYPEEETETRPPPEISEDVLMELYSDSSAVLGGMYLLEIIDRFV